MSACGLNFYALRGAEVPSTNSQQCLQMGIPGNRSTPSPISSVHSLESVTGTI